MKAVVLDGYTLNPGDLSWKEIEALCDLKVFDKTPETEVSSRITDCEIVLTNKTPITKTMIDQAPKLKYIGVLATGYNVVNIEAAKKKEIIVTNIPDYSSQAVAQFVFALILEICHHVGHHNDAVKNGCWAENGNFSFWDYPLIELSEKTLGIIGYGHIGKRVADMAHAFGMNVIVYTRTVNKDSSVNFVSLDELFASSDFITLHTPLSEETANMIDKKAIEKIKDGAVLINTARGGLVNEQDLYEALESGKLKFAALDVNASEPIHGDSVLLKAKNILITPHMAWATFEARTRLMHEAAENLRAFLEGKPVHSVNS